MNDPTLREWVETQIEGIQRSSANYATECALSVFRQVLIQIDKHHDQNEARIKELETLINTPHTEDWLEAVPLEAAHQISRWGTSHDQGKEPQDWFWLLGWLSGKAVHAATIGDTEKAKHHTISSAAVLLNWHRHLSGEETTFRPGIAEPTEVHND